MTVVLDVLAVLESQIPCFRPVTPSFPPRSGLTKKVMDENQDVRDDYKDWNEGLKDPGQGGRRRPEEPWFYHGTGPHDD